VYAADTFILKAVSSSSPWTDHGFIPAHGDRSSESQPVVMQAAVVESAARAIAAYCAKFHQPRALIGFQGDEPLLAGAAWFSHAVKTFRNQMPSSCVTTFAVHTSGISWDETWADLFTELGIRVSINVDTSSTVRDTGRLHQPGACSYSGAVRAAKSIQRHPGMKDLFGGVLCVVNPEDDGLQIYRHFRSVGVTAIDFVLPITANWDCPPSPFENHTPFADYLIPIFDEWWSENNPNVRIGYFDDLLRLAVGSHIHSDSLGIDPLSTVVVNCNGGIETVDWLYRCGNGLTKLGLKVHGDPIERAFQQPTLQKALAGQEHLCQTCRQCDIRDVCGGGYLPSRFRQANGFDNPSIFCADLTKLIHHVVDSCTRQLVATT